MTTPVPQADSQPLREGEWINDAGRIKWLLWRVQDLEAKLAARAPAASVTALAGGVEDDVDAIDLAHIDCGEAGCAEGCCGNAKCLPSAAPAQQPWQYTPPAQERIDALELEVRQLTEQIAGLRKGLELAIKQNSHDMLMTGEELRKCEAALAGTPQAADSVLEDAARYRWIAAHCRSTSEHWGGRWSIVVDGPAPKSHDSEDDFNAAIDAARKHETAAMAAKKGYTHE